MQVTHASICWKPSIIRQPAQHVHLSKNARYRRSLYHEWAGLTSRQFDVSDRRIRIADGPPVKPRADPRSTIYLACSWISTLQLIFAEP